MTEAIFSKTIAFYDQCLDGKTNFQGIDLEETTLDNLLLHQHCNFDQASFAHCSLVNAHLPDCSMKAVNFEKAIIKNAVLRHGQYQQACFKGANLTKSNLSESNCQHTNFSGADLTGCNLSKADLRGAILTDAIIVNTNFQDALYDIQTQFPIDCDPFVLGMTISETIGPLTDSNGNISQAYDSKPKTKEIMYRGSKMIVEIEKDTTSEAEEKSTVKEITYRGQRTMIETKAAKRTIKEGLQYRGSK